MARVQTISTRVRDFTGGVVEFDVEARSVRGLIRELDARWPGLGAFVDAEMSIAIDGEIFQDAFLEPIEDASEVVLIPKIAGG